MIKNVEIVTVENLNDKVASKLPLGFRFVTMTCTDCIEYFDILYHFDKNYELSNLRLQLKKGDSLPSISPIIFAALIVENEIKDLFGVNVTGLILDYDNRLLLTSCAPERPLCRVPGVLMTEAGKPAETPAEDK
jgi:ech hydrogenase subunit D